MKLAAWNLNHKASGRKLKAGIAEAARKLDLDVLILTEYVHGNSRAPLTEALESMGLRHIRFSERLNLNNQVLIASRSPLELGDLSGPNMHDLGGVCNFLHVRLPDVGVEVVGLRAPAYESSPELRDYWTQLTATIRAGRDRSIIFAGDLNADPRTTRRVGDKHLAALCSEGWQVPDAVGEWSYASGTRVDHAILSPSFKVAAASYVVEVEGVLLAGRGNPLAVSDHAALVVQLTAPGEA